MGLRVAPPMLRSRSLVAQPFMILSSGLKMGMNYMTTWAIIKGITSTRDEMG